MAALTSRNLKVFLRDRVSVVMSFFAVLVIIALYALFLGNMLVEDFQASGLAEAEATDIVNTWVIAGIIGVTTMTSSLGALGVMVEDRATAIERDFMVAPMKRSAIALSYALSMFCIGSILSLATFLVGELYIVGTGGEWLTAEQTAQVIGGILLSVASSGSIVLFITSFLHTMGGYSMVSLVIGVSVGFLTGVYIPIGSMAEGVAGAVKLFPVSYSASYFRLLMTDSPIAAAFDGAPQEMVEEYQEALGICFNIDGTKTDLQTAVIVMIITSCVFLALTCLVFAAKRRKV